MKMYLPPQCSHGALKVLSWGHTWCVLSWGSHEAVICAFVVVRYVFSRFFRGVTTEGYAPSMGFRGAFMVLS